LIKEISHKVSCLKISDDLIDLEDLVYLFQDFQYMYCDEPEKYKNAFLDHICRLIVVYENDYINPRKKIRVFADRCFNIYPTERSAFPLSLANAGEPHLGTHGLP